MNRNQAEKRIRRKLLKIKQCPFCGKRPTFRISCDSEHTPHGSWGHYAKRYACCKVYGCGQAELFFCNNWERADYKLWWRMLCGMVDDWNRRAPLPAGEGE